MTVTVRYAFPNNERPFVLTQFNTIGNPRHHAQLSLADLQALAYSVQQAIEKHEQRHAED
jgi:hypothetical protein